MKPPSSAAPVPPAGGARAEVEAGAAHHQGGEDPQGEGGEQMMAWLVAHVLSIGVACGFAWLAHTLAEQTRRRRRT